MNDTELISVVIPCYTRGLFVHETIESIQRQTHPHWEIILVDDGAEEPETVAAIETLERQTPPGVRIVREPHRGLPHAHNRGFHLARGRYVIPLDSDDLLEPEMMEVCLRAMRSHPKAGFAYFDYRVFGDKNFIHHAGDYNLYRLMHENFFSHCLFLRREVWQDVGGYDEWHHFSYEDWQFALQLGAHGWYGHYIPQVLFNYRTHGRGHHYIGIENHDKNWAHMTAGHPSLYSPRGRLNVKRRWAPSICFVVRGGEPDFESQTVQDYQVLVGVDEATALEQSNAPCFLWMSDARTLQPYAAEQCIWGLRSASWVTWSDTGEAPRPSLRNARRTAWTQPRSARTARGAALGKGAPVAVAVPPAGGNSGEARFAAARSIGSIAGNSINAKRDLLPGPRPTRCFRGALAGSDSPAPGKRRASFRRYLAKRALGRRRKAGSPALEREDQRGGGPPGL